MDAIHHLQRAADRSGRPKDKQDHRYLGMGPDALIISVCITPLKVL